MLTEPKFKIGQRVFLGADRRARIRDPYRITRVLPTEGGDQQYRVKSAREAHERVVPEGQLDEVAMAETERRPAEPNRPSDGREGHRRFRNQGRSQAEVLWAEVSGHGLRR
jgi:hypothetical protein